MSSVSPHPPRRTSSERIAFAAKLPALGLRRLLDKLLAALTQTPTTFVEFASSTSLIYLGIILSHPTVSLVPSTPLFALMLKVMPEGAWAGVFLVVGVFQSVANLSRHVGLRRYAAFAAFLLFGFVGLLGASVQPVSLFGALCKVHALIQVAVYWRLGVSGAR